MQQIINFILRKKNFLLFILLFGFSIGLTIQSHSYHKSKFINSANFITGGLYKQVNAIDQYFDLKKQNEILIEENTRLKSLLYNTETDSLSSVIDTVFNESHFRIRPAKVYKNSYSSINNILLINKGAKDSIKQDFGVITSKGIVGIVNNTSNGYATVISILNTNSRINAQLKSSNHFGSLVWDTQSPEIVQLKDISKFAPIKKGDTIITGGQSTIFPKGIPIGSIQEYTLDNSGDTYTIQVKLFNDMTSIGHVYVIENLNASEINSLLNDTNE